jgi:hypothetical protein
LNEKMENDLKFSKKISYDRIELVQLTFSSRI